MCVCVCVCSCVWVGVCVWVSVCVCVPTHRCAKGLFLLINSSNNCMDQVELWPTDAVFIIIDCDRPRGFFLINCSHYSFRHICAQLLNLLEPPALFLAVSLLPASKLEYNLCVLTSFRRVIYRVVRRCAAQRRVCVTAAQLKCLSIASQCRLRASAVAGRLQLGGRM